MTVKIQIMPVLFHMIRQADLQNCKQLSSLLNANLLNSDFILYENNKKDLQMVTRFTMIVKKEAKKSAGSLVRRRTRSVIKLFNATKWANQFKI